MPRSVAFAITARSTARASDGHSIGGSIVGATMLSSFSAFHGLYRGGQHYSSAADARVVLFSARARASASLPLVLSLPLLPIEPRSPGSVRLRVLLQQNFRCTLCGLGQKIGERKNDPLVPFPRKSERSRGRLEARARGSRRGSSRFADRSAVLGAPLPLPCAFLKKLKPSKPPLHP